MSFWQKACCCFCLFSTIEKPQINTKQPRRQKYNIPIDNENGDQFVLPPPTTPIPIPPRKKTTNNTEFEISNPTPQYSSSSSSGLPSYSPIATKPSNYNAPKNPKLPTEKTTINNYNEDDYGTIIWNRGNL